MGIRGRVKEQLTERLDREYEKALVQKKVDYDSWVREQEARLRQGESPIPVGDGASEEYILFCQKKGRMNEGAQERIGRFFAAHQECLILYGDEDILGEDGIRRDPWYKPCWSPDLYLDCFYPGSVVALRKSFAEKVLTLPRELAEKGDRILFGEISDDIRNCLDRAFSAAGGFERGCSSIARLPEILFHAKDPSLWEQYLRAASGLQREDGRDPGTVSVIIPSRDNPGVLEKCLSALTQGGSRRDLDIIVVDNGSSPENRRILEELTRGGTYLYRPMEFNFSAMCNLGAAQAKGDLLLFLNDDVEVSGREWLEAMKRKAALPYVGAVGLKLLYPGGEKIQHAGVTNLTVGPVHKMQYLRDDIDHYFGRNRLNYNGLAVTAACLMTEKKKFLEAGGFREDLKIAYNDVELCFHLWEAGYQNVTLNHFSAVHHESLSRGNDEADPEKFRRLEKERKLLYELHPTLKGRDPYYPEQLNGDGLDSHILPGYVYSRSFTQPPAWKRLPAHLAAYREDPCVMVRVETAGPERIQGYSVVLGDDNACYEQYLILCPEEKFGTDGGELFCMKLEKQYREDLEENLPDQKHVALAGFRAGREGENLPPGDYRIGVLAVHRFARLKLLGWSEKSLRTPVGE